MWVPENYEKQLHHIHTWLGITPMGRPELRYSLCMFNRWYAQTKEGCCLLVQLLSILDIWLTTEKSSKHGHKGGSKSLMHKPTLHLRNDEVLRIPEKLFEGEGGVDFK